MENDFLFMYHILCFCFCLFLCSYYKILFVIGSPLHAKSRQRKKQVLLNRHSLFFVSEQGGTILLDVLLLVSLSINLLLMNLINITLLYFITPFYNCLLVSLYLYYSNSHSLHHFIYNNYNFQDHYCFCFYCCHCSYHSCHHQYH